jgi:hypothetical protein
MSTMVQTGISAVFSYEEAQKEIEHRAQFAKGISKNRIEQMITLSELQRNKMLCAIKRHFWT